MRSAHVGGGARVDEPDEVGVDLLCALPRGSKCPHHEEVQGDLVQHGRPLHLDSQLLARRAQSASVDLASALMVGSTGSIVSIVLWWTGRKNW